MININKTSGKETVMFLWLKFIAGDYLIGDRRGQNLSHQQRLAALHPERGGGKQEGVMEKRRRRLTRRWNGRTLPRVKEGEKAEG